MRVGLFGFVWLLSDFNPNRIESRFFCGSSFNHEFEVSIFLRVDFESVDDGIKGAWTCGRSGGATRHDELVGVFVVVTELGGRS